MIRRRQLQRIRRRQFLLTVSGCASVATASALFGSRGRAEASVAPDRSGPADTGPFFLTRGVVVVLGDLRTLDWPERARRAGLTTVSTHIFPHEVASYIQSDEGRKFLEDCRKRGVQVEHELHAMSDLLPRALFDKDPAMFPMNEKGDRVPDFNLCVHSPAAVQVACENARKYTKILRSTTGRYFYWIDDGQPMCRCPKCRGLSDSDQALLLEHHLLDAIREVDARASLAQLAYSRTLQPPTQVRPRPGIFLEFAPIERRYDVPFSRRDARGFGGATHGKLLDAPRREPPVVRPRRGPGPGVLARFVAFLRVETRKRQAAPVAQGRLHRRLEDILRAGRAPRDHVRRLDRRRLRQAFRRPADRQVRVRPAPAGVREGKREGKRKGKREGKRGKRGKGGNKREDRMRVTGTLRLFPPLIFSPFPSLLFPFPFPYSLSNTTRWPTVA